MIAVTTMCDKKVSTLDNSYPYFISQKGGTTWTLNGVILGLFFDFLQQTEIK